MKTREEIQEEALQTILPLRRAGVGVSMGVGKTLIALLHMDRNHNLASKFLVVASKKSILKEWIEEAKKHNLAHLIPHIHLSTYLSLSKQEQDYDVIYLDECHSLLFSHQPWLNNFKGKIIGLTGSPPRYALSEKGKMVNNYCPIVYTYETDDAIEDKILNDYQIIIHKLTLNTAKTMLIEKKNNSWYDSEFNTYQYWSKRIDDAVHKKEQQIMSVMRMKALMEFPSKELLSSKLLSEITNKCILFANTQEQADRLCKHSYHSKNPDSEQNLLDFKENKITKMSAVLQLNEGVNIPNLKEGIILHAYGNERKAAQRIGRLLRLNPDDTATVHILCYMGTVDEKWVFSALANFDKTKIKIVEH